MKQRAKTGGREKGVPNKTTKTARDWITALIEKNRVQVGKDLKSLEPKDRLMIIEKFMAYTIPKMSSSKVSINELSDQHLDTLIIEITKNLEDEN